MADDDAVTADPDPADDAKEKFRQALERKKGSAPDGVAGARQSTGPHGGTDTHQHGGKREFRRKAGP